MKVSHEKYMMTTLSRNRGVITSKKSESESSQGHPRGSQIKRFIRGSWNERMHFDMGVDRVCDRRYGYMMAIH